MTKKREEFIADKETVVMVAEPSPELTTEKATEQFAQVKSESDLAKLYAAVSNKAWWKEDCTYDYEKDTDEYKIARIISKEWFRIEKEIKEEIFNILESEGVSIPSKAQITMLIPFMQRNGFCHQGGWWIKVGDKNV